MNKRDDFDSLLAVMREGHRIHNTFEEPPDWKNEMRRRIDAIAVQPRLSFFPAWLTMPEWGVACASLLIAVILQAYMFVNNTRTAQGTSDDLYTMALQSSIGGDSSAEILWGEQ